MNSSAIAPARFEQGRALNLVGLAERFSMADLSGLPRLWQRFGPSIERDRDSYGVCYNPDEEGGFDYLAGIEATGATGLPEGLRQLTLAPQYYAVFEHHGSLQGLKDTFAAIFQQWLPASGEHSANAAVFERYPAGFDPADPHAVMEIWVPLAR